ncbi:hypothetical protein FRC03_011132 [Tulasnella sp. 419]|nr:hypothetical protein FRC03_011132 [Tulasnella sp. 419]
MHSATLRRRQMALDRSKEKHTKTDEHEPVHDDNAKSDAKSKDRKHPRRQTLHPKQIQSRVYVLLSAALITTFIALFNRSSSQALPDSWALCSKGHGQIYTVDDRNPTIECIVINDGIIVDSGSIKDIRKRWGDRDTTGPVSTAPRTQSYKTGLKIKFLKLGQAAYPGFTDAHAHIMDYGATRELQLTGSSSIDEIIHRVRDYILSRPEVLNDTSVWIESLGWDQNRFPGGQFPTAVRHLLLCYAELAKEEFLRRIWMVIRSSRVDRSFYIE